MTAPERRPAVFLQQQWRFGATGTIALAVEAETLDGEDWHELVPLVEMIEKWVGAFPPAPKDTKQAAS